MNRKLIGAFAGLLCVAVALLLHADPAKTEAVTYKSGDENVSGFLALPDGGGKHPAIVVIHEWWGLNDQVKEDAQKLAAQGFVALAVDLYRGKVAATADEAVAVISRRAAAVLDVTSALGVMATVMLIVHLFTRETTLAETRLAGENARSERLLLNILPAKISSRLKGEDKSIADGFADVTVLFADIVGFTELSQKLTPDRLVEILNHIFSGFDDLAERFGLEKIKTIGDCYMVAAGLPEVCADHAEAIARMALGMRSELERVNRLTGHSLRIRIGIHSGPVVAGVIGKRKFIYDLWGDTVNTASRMESSGVAEEIQVTRAVYEKLAGKFEMEARGTIHVKGKGNMETYLLKAEITP